MTTRTTDLTKAVCWTRIQAEAGQDIGSIIARKEAERRAGDGLFFWGVGNAPSRSIGKLSAESEEIDVIFSLMKRRPQARDVSPSGVVAWQTYFDCEGVERSIPPHVLVTSRKESSTGNKSVHYALVCQSDEELRLADQGTFDLKAYRNIGAYGGPVGNSQVTALLVRTRDEVHVSDYRINFRAKLVGGYWVKLARPRVLDESAIAKLSRLSLRATEMKIEEWAEAVSEIRSDSMAAIERQASLFELPTP